MNVNSKGLISWFSRNPVAANLVMVLVFFAGAISLTTISKEMFPRSERNMISISVPYPGAAPVEVEKGVILPMESVLEGLQGIKKITSGADRDYGRIYLETVSYTHLRAHETLMNLVCRLLLEKSHKRLHLGV